MRTLVWGLLLLVLAACTPPAAAESPKSVHGALRMGTIGDCNNLAGVGVWENATPDAVWAQLPNGGCGYGVRSFSLDPNDSNSIFLGTCNMGIWSTHDCGATWAHIDTGMNGPTLLDKARQWFYQIDPTNSLVQYTSSGYGPNVPNGNGMYKSVDGAVNWTVSFPPVDGSLHNVVSSNFAGSMVMDPANNLHLLLTFHASCNAPYTNGCFGESFDGGVTWKLVNGNPTWVGNLGGQYLWLLQDASHLLYANSVNGYWYSSGGLAGPWTQVAGMTTQEGHEGGQMVTTTGYFYMPVSHGVARSVDGVTWAVIPNSGGTGSSMATDGITIFWEKGFSGSPYPPFEPYKSSLVTDGLTWVTYTSPLMVNGGWMAYDPVHSVLYSSNRQAGFWRVRLH